MPVSENGHVRLRNPCIWMQSSFVGVENPCIKYDGTAEGLGLCTVCHWSSGKFQLQTFSLSVVASGNLVGGILIL